MKRLLAYLFIVLGLGLTFSVNSKETNATLRVPTVEKCESFDKGDTNWYYNNCDQLSSQDNNVTLKSAINISKKDKKPLEDYNYSGTFLWNYSFLIDDLRGRGPVYYIFNIDQYYRLDKYFNVLSKGTFTEKKKIFKLKENKLNFYWKVSIPDKIIDIKSKYYDYKGYRRYQIRETTETQKELIKNSIIKFGKNEYAKVDSNKDGNLKSGIQINKDKKITYLKIGEKDKAMSGYGLGYFYNKAHKINDLRGDGAVYYKFDVKTGNAGLYYRLNQDHKVISKGNFQYNKKKKAFELNEDGEIFLWRVSMDYEIVDINSKVYDYKGYRRFQYVEAEDNAQNKIYSSIKNFEEGKYVEVGSGKSDNSSFGYKIAKKYDESDDNLNKLWNLILENKDIKKKYLKYSKKKATFKGKPIKAIGLAVFIDYKKELSILTMDKNVKQISSPIAWGWEYSHKDPAKIKDFITDKTAFSGFEAIRNCYKSVRKKKLSFRDGECILVDVRRITNDSQYPVISYNYLIEAKKNRILLAKESVKSKQQIADEKKEEEKKKKTLMLAQKKAKEETKKQEKILAKQKKEEEIRKKKFLLAQKKAEEETKKQELLLLQKKTEEEKKKQELLITQKKAEEEKKKKELLLAQKKAEEERKKQEFILAQKKAEEEKKKQELLLAEEKAKEEKKKQELIAKLKEQEQKKINELELAKKEAEKEFEKKKNELNIDQDSPEIIVAEAITVNSQVYKLKGKVVDTSDFFLEIDGQPIKLNKNGEFVFEGFVIDENEGEELTLVAVDRWNNVSERSVKINVEIKEQQIVKTYEKLLPNKIKATEDDNKIALVIGVEKYENLTNLDAIYANRDAKAFRAYANRAFGIPMKNIKVLIDKEASRSEIIKATKLWLPQVAKGGGKEIYIFFAGHGLASDDGENLFLLPQDGDSLLLEDTAISRLEIFNQVAKLDPKSVTIFFDTCYSGQTRSEETLIAGLRPIRLIAEEKEVPDNFTIFSASNLTQTSGSIDEARHGIFSYYLMKGLEGNADSNLDNSITNGELITYLKENVGQEAFAKNRQQEPMLNGNPDYVLLKY